MIKSNMFLESYVSSRLEKSKTDNEFTLHMEDGMKTHIEAPLSLTPYVFCEADGFFFILFFSGTINKENLKEYKRYNLYTTINQVI